MPQACKFCHSPQRAFLEEAISTGAISQTDAAQRLNCDKSSVTRHIQNHLTPAIQQAIKDDHENALALNVVDALTSSHGKTLEILETAMSNGDVKSALDALRTEVQQLKLMATVSGQINAAPQLNFMLDARYMQVKEVMMRVLEPFPELKEKMADALLDVGDDDAQSESESKY